MLSKLKYLRNRKRTLIFHKSVSTLKASGNKFHDRHYIVFYNIYASARSEVIFNIIFQVNLAHIYFACPIPGVVAL